MVIFDLIVQFLVSFAILASKDVMTNQHDNLYNDDDSS